MEDQLVKAKLIKMKEFPNSLMMNLVLITTLINYGLAFPTEKKMLEVDEMPCHPEALEVRVCPSDPF